MMHDAKKSEAGIVAMKAANNGAQARAELPERRAVDQVRRAENKRLRAAGDERLSGTKYDWLRHPASFSEDAGRAVSAINRTSSTPAASTAEDSIGPPATRKPEEPTLETPLSGKDYTSCSPAWPV